MLNFSRPSSAEGASEDAIVKAGTWRTFGERVVYDSPWLSVNLVDVHEPGGKRFEHHAIRMRPVALIALIKDNRVLISYRHRFIPDTWAWELPGGIVDDGESPDAAAMREGGEETGWQASTVEHLITFEPMPGIAATPHHVYVGRNPKQVATAQISECVKMEWIPINSIPDLLRDGDISDSAAVIGLQQLYIGNQLNVSRLAG